MRIKPLTLCSGACVLFAWLLAGCGGGLKYRVDDGAMGAVPSGERQSVFAAQNELEIAKGETRTVQTQMDALERDRGIAKTEREQASLEVEKAQAQVEASILTRNENEAAQSKHNKDAAELGVKAAEQKLTWLDEKQTWLEASKKAAEAHVLAAQAKIEVEKARVAQKKGIKPDGDFDVSNYEDQFKDAQSDWESAKKKASSEEQDSKDAEASWKELVTQQQKSRG